MSNLTLRLTHKANDAFRAVIGEVVATTLDPFCKTRKVEVVYTLSPDDVPFASIAASLNNHTVSGRTGKSLDRVKKKLGDFMGEHAIEVIGESLAPLAKIVAAPEAPVDMSDVLAAVDAIPEAPVEQEAPTAPQEPQDEPEAVVATPTSSVRENVAAKSLLPKVRGADLLANLYRDIKKGKK
jgi:hypothetical protein